jgi:hypothetical protein
LSPFAFRPIKNIFPSVPLNIQKNKLLFVEIQTKAPLQLPIEFLSKNEAEMRGIYEALKAAGFFGLMLGLMFGLIILTLTVGSSLGKQVQLSYSLHLLASAIFVAVLLYQPTMIFSSVSASWAPKAVLAASQVYLGTLLSLLRVVLGRQARSFVEKLIPWYMTVILVPTFVLTLFSLDIFTISMFLLTGVVGIFLSQ